jgi:hypothetical protein
MKRRRLILLIDFSLLGCGNTLFGPPPHKQNNPRTTRYSLSWLFPSHCADSFRPQCRFTGAHRNPNLWIDETKKAQGSASAALGFLSHLVLPASLAAVEDIFVSDRVSSSPYLSYQGFMITVKQRFS